MRIRLIVSIILAAGIAVLSVANAIAGPREDFEEAGQANADGDYDTAINLYTKIIEEGDVAPHNLAATYYNRGNAYREMENYDKAIEDFTSAISLNPNYTKAYSNRGAVYTALERYPEALEDFTKVLDLSPGNALHHFNRGLVYHKMGRLDEALKDFDEAVKLNDKFSSSYYARSFVHEEKGDMEKALEDARMAVERTPDFGPFQERLEELESKTGVTGKEQ